MLQPDVRPGLLGLLVLALTTSLPWPAAADGIMLVPAGAFWRGRHDGPPEEAPRHRMYVRDVWIERRKVTNAELAAFLNAAGLVSPAGQRRRPASARSAWRTCWATCASGRQARSARTLTGSTPGRGTAAAACSFAAPVMTSRPPRCRQRRGARTTPAAHRPATTTWASGARRRRIWARWPPGGDE